MFFIDGLNVRRGVGRDVGRRADSASDRCDHSDGVTIWHSHTIGVSWALFNTRFVELRRSICRFNFELYYAFAASCQPRCGRFCTTLSFYYLRSIKDRSFKSYPNHYTCKLFIKPFIDMAVSDSHPQVLTRVTTSPKNRLTHRLTTATLLSYYSYSHKRDLCCCPKKARPRPFSSIVTSTIV